MIRPILTSIAVLVIASVMTMTGRGGGNFYVPMLVTAGLPIHEAAANGQLILVIAAVTAMLVFQKHKMVDWKLALVIDPPTDIMAFVGGYFFRLGERHGAQVPFGRIAHPCGHPDVAKSSKETPQA